MKTVLYYLEEQKQMAWHNRLCYSKTYAMETPKDGYEKEFANAVRDCEIVDDLIKLVLKNDKEPSNKQTALCNVEICFDMEKYLRMKKQLERELIQAHELISLELKQTLDNAH